MSAIRPDLPSGLPAPAAGASSPARTAQAAFFRAALGEAQAAAAAPIARPTDTSEARLPRPGQLLDIRV